MQFMFLFFFLILNFGDADFPADERMEVQVTGIAQEGKVVYVAIYRPEDRFPDMSAAWKYTKFTSSGSTGTAYLDLPFGDYALAAFQDDNGNGKLDKNILGYPKEPFAFSGGFRPVLGPPKFRNCRFSFDGQHRQIGLRLER